MACTTSLPPSGGFPRGRRWSARPGRASSSTSWIEDKLRANAAPTHVGGGERRIAGHASSSESWVQDKLSWRRAPESPNSVAGGGRKKSPCSLADRVPFGSAGERKRSPSSPEDRLDKKARLAHHEGDGKKLEEKFADLSIVAPDPNDLPLPNLLLSLPPDPNDLSLPNLLLPHFID